MMMVRKRRGFSARFQALQTMTAGFRQIRLAGLAGAVLVLAGCATVVRGTHETFRIVSTPAGAVAQLSSGESCVTPCAVEIARANPFEVRIAKPGFVTQRVAVRSAASGAAGIGLLSNAIVGGIVGASVDLSSGAMRNLTPNPVQVRLVEVFAIAPADFPVIPLIPAASLSDGPDQKPASAPEGTAANSMKSIASSP